MLTVMITTVCYFRSLPNCDAYATGKLMALQQVEYQFLMQRNT